MPKNTLSHYLVGYYITHQPDGVHIEACCTCGVFTPSLRSIAADTSPISRAEMGE